VATRWLNAAAAAARAAQALNRLCVIVAWPTASSGSLAQTAQKQ